MAEDTTPGNKFPGAADVKLTWLGQAGFLIENGECRIALDPYLSDSLYEKYKDSRFQHVRMVPAPYLPGQLTGLKLVLCTHGHTDHMDPGTLPGLASANPGCRFICPAAEREKALERGVPAGLFVGLDDGGCFDDSSCSGAVVTALASAHEALAADATGRNYFLGYVISVGGLLIYHSGDCIPYDGLVESLKNLRPDIALLPVNGRDENRRTNGIPGNFTVGEAARLCIDTGIGRIIPHHFGMFDFNTADPAVIEEVLSESGLRYTIPEIGKPIRLNTIKENE